MLRILKKARAPLLLLGALALINTPLIFCGRTLLNIAPSNGLLPGKPYGYHGPELDSTTNIDQVGSFNNAYAWDAYAAHCLRAGVIPFWDPYQGLGQPFLAVGSSAVLYPLNWLHLILPAAWWDLVYLLNWLLAGIFLYAYLRVLGITAESAFVAALALFACGSIQLYLPSREVVGVAAWWPFLLYTVERAYRQADWRGRHVFLAIAIFCSVTAGQPESTFLSLLVVTAYAGLRAFTDRNQAVRLVSGLAPGAAAGVLLSAPHWLNFVNYAFTSFTEHTPVAAKGLIHMPLRAFASYVFPYFFGRLQHNPFGAAPFDWTYAPGWITPLCLFLALVSLASFRANPTFALGFLWLISVLALAKIFNLPGVRSVGTVPYFELTIYPRYAAFIPAVALAVLAAFGISLLARANHRTCLAWIIIWTALVSSAFALGALSIPTPLSASSAGSEARQTFIIFGFGGLAWAILQPLGLWWVKYRRPSEALALYALAAFGILLHSVAFAANGYSTKAYGALSAAALIAYVLVAGGVGLIRSSRITLTASLAVFPIVGALPVIATTLSSHGLPSRYNPLTIPPYIEPLVSLQQGNLYRSYSLGPVPGPDFAAPLELSSLDNINAISPVGTAKFMVNYLDPVLSSLYFVGHRGPVGPPFQSALDEIKLNRKYYSLIGVKYLVTTDLITGGADPNVYDSLGPFVGSATPVPIITPLRAALFPTTDQISILQVLIGTYGKKNCGLLQLQVFDEDGNLVESSTISSLGLVNNAYCDFHFSNLTGLNRKHLQLVLDFRPESTDSMVAAFVPPDSSVIGFAFRARSPDQSFRLVHRDEGTGTDIWENHEATPRVFLAPEVYTASSTDEALSGIRHIPSLTRTVIVENGLQTQLDPDPTQPAGSVREFLLSPNEVAVKYKANMPSILTITDAFSDGWHAEINGREIPVLKVDGVFRGVKIDTAGDGEVRMWYRPPRWNLSLALCCIGAIVLAVPLLITLRSRRE